MNFIDDLEKYSRNTAVIIKESKQISYKDLLETADSIGKQINNRCLVLVVCKNCFESVTGYIGFLRAGAVLALVQETIDDIFLVNLLKEYKPDYIYLPAE